MCFLANARIGWMIGVPRQVRKSWRSENDVMLVVEAAFCYFRQAIAVACFVPSLHRQNIDRRIFVASLQSIRNKYFDFGGAILKRRNRTVDENAVLFCRRRNARYLVHGKGQKNQSNDRCDHVLEPRNANQTGVTSFTIAPLALAAVNRLVDAGKIELIRCGELILVLASILAT